MLLPLLLFLVAMLMMTMMMATMIMLMILSLPSYLLSLFCSSLSLFKSSYNAVMNENKRNNHMTLQVSVAKRLCKRLPCTVSYTEWIVRLY